MFSERPSRKAEVKVRFRLHNRLSWPPTLFGKIGSDSEVHKGRPSDTASVRPVSSETSSEVPVALLAAYNESLLGSLEDTL